MSGFSVLLDSDTAAAALRDFLRANWRLSAAAGKPLFVSIEHGAVRHTDRQRRRYNALLRTIAASVWIDLEQHDRDWWHDFFARRFIGEDAAGEPLSTADLNVVEMNMLMQEIEHYAVDTLGLELDVP